MNRLIINGCTLEMTCGACPEQYDVFFNDFKIGYLRLRYGGFSACYLGSNGEQVYYASPKGDGIFEDDERFHFLKEAVDALLMFHNNRVIQLSDDYV